MAINIKRLIISLFLPQLAGAIGSLFNGSSSMVWYNNLEKPSFNPPGWIFAPAWILLYLMMGISVYLIWQKLEQNDKSRQALTIFWVHLFFNATWSPVFFGLKMPGLAFLNIIIIWFFIIVLMIDFWPIDRRAACLLAPYFLWVSFASMLNLFIWL